MTLKDLCVKLVYTPEDCVNLCEGVDEKIGDFLKKLTNRWYREHRNASEENNDAWANDDVSASERRKSW